MRSINVWFLTRMIEDNIYGKWMIKVLNQLKKLFNRKIKYTIIIILLTHEGEVWSVICESEVWIMSAVVVGVLYVI